MTIGLVNNMAASAAVATYERFSLALADTGYAFELRHLTLMDACEAPAGCTPVNGGLEADIDALIVTGMQPVEADLRDEWLWPRLANLHDWCERNSIPAIWSCLSAHAAVLHSDRIGRRQLDSKLSGVLGCVRVASHHPIMNAMPDTWECPHSRYNSLPEDELIASGYTILSRAGAEVDMFTRADGTPFFYFQGHPEYQHDTLLREFMRDNRRFICGESKIQPALPDGYAGEEAALWCARQDHAEGRNATMAGVPRTGWRAARRQLFMNWMDIAAAYASASGRALMTAGDRTQMIDLCTAAQP